MDSISSVPTYAWPSLTNTLCVINPVVLLTVTMTATIYFHFCQ